MSVLTTTEVLFAEAIRMDLDAPAKEFTKPALVPGWQVSLRTPDIVDPVTDTVAWFNDEGALEISADMAPRLLEHLRSGDRFALRAYRLMGHDDTLLPSLSAITRLVAA